MATLTEAGRDALNVVGRRLRAYLSSEESAQGSPEDSGQHLLIEAGLLGDAIVEVNDAARALRVDTPGLVPYAQLSDDDKRWFDKACGIKAALVLLEPAAALARSGLAKIKEGDEERTFRAPEPRDRRALEAEAAEAVGRLSCMIQAEQIAPFSAFRVTGSIRPCWDPPCF